MHALLQLTEDLNTLIRTKNLHRRVIYISSSHNLSFYTGFNPSFNVRTSSKVLK